MADPRYRALLIGNSTFPADSNNLQTLEGPVNDVALLRGALTDRDSGLFEAGSVRMLPERTSGEILVELEQFFGAARRDDVLLLYYSGHGLLNERGQLFLCARDTRTDLLKSTSVSSTAVNMMFDESAARTTIIVLDCCHSGAFKGGSFPDALRGSGRFLLTSCRSGQLANDADRRNGTSLFTQHLVNGITGGASDSDADGYVEVGEVFDYVSERLRAEGRQIPQRSFAGDGDVAIARRAAVVAAGPRPDPPPPDPTPQPTPGPPPFLAQKLPPEGGKRAKNRVGMAAAVVVALVAVAVAVAALTLGGGGEGEATKSTTTAATAVTATTPTTAAPSGAKAVAVPSNVAWTDTGIDVRAGQLLDVTASGTVNTATDIPNRSSPADGIAGEENSENNSVTGARHGAVVGRIGPDGTPFLVGSSLRRPAPSTGRLYLGINDRGLANNSGQFDARVSVTG